MTKEFSLEWLREELLKLRNENKKFNLANLVPSIFVMQGEEEDTFAVQVNHKWSKDKSSQQLLPSIMAYRSALLKELRTAEYYIKYLKDDGCYPQGKILINVSYKEKETQTEGEKWTLNL